MNIWLMNHYSSVMFFDKAGRHYWFAKKLIARGNNVTVFGASTLLNRTDIVDTGSKKWILKEENSIPFIFVKCPPSMGNGIDRVKNMVSFFFNLFPVTREYAKKAGKPDVIVASSVHPLTMVAGILIAKKMKIPCVCEIRDLWPEAIFAFGKTTETRLLGRILTAGEHWIYRKADALIFTKEGDTDYLKEKKWTTEQGGDIDLHKCHYINNGVDLEAYNNQIDEIVFEDEDLKQQDKFNVVYAGAIRPVNNVGNILDCAKILQANPKYDKIHFSIFGDGSEFKTIKSRVEDEKITNVSIKGAVERKYIPNILSKSNVNILNYSQKEYNWSRGNSSNKLFEYMASGKPVISTVKMGYSIINRYNCGIELDSCTPECLAEAIIRFFEMPESEYNAFAENAKIGAENFDYNILTDKLTEVIQSVLGK